MLLGCTPKGRSSPNLWTGCRTPSSTAPSNGTKAITDEELLPAGTNSSAWRSPKSLIVRVSETWKPACVPGPNLLYHPGLRGHVARSTLADANEQRDWRIYADLAQKLIRRARRLYAQETFAVELDQTVYAFDSTTIELCLNLFPWARFRHRKGGIKLHTLLDLHGSIPSFIRLTDAACHDVNALDALPLEPGAFYLMDRGYVDLARLYRFTQAGAFFVTRA